MMRTPVAALAGVTLLAAALVPAVAAGAAPPLEDPLVLTPGVTEPRVEPETWSVDLRDLDRDQAQAAAGGLSSRVYGGRDGDLAQPLELRTDYDHDVVLGIYITAVCLCGVDLDVEIDGEFFHRLSWAPAGSTHRPETVYHLTVPAGDHTVSLDVSGPGGPVVVGDYTFALSVDALPPDRPREELRQQEPPPPDPEPNVPWPGYRGIWFELGQVTEWGDKYSGGLGTYTMNHSPLAVYAPEVDTTFFTYGGTTQADQRDLLIMAAEYDHTRHRVSRPVVVETKPGVNDPHDNGSIAIDAEGHVWIFVSGRGQSRPGFKYRSLEPYSVDGFELITTEEMTYPQPRFIDGEGFYNSFTKYTAGRELYWETSADGVAWSEDHELAGFGGHYQVTEEHDGTVVSAFNYHPGGNVDARTNVYVAITDDLGRTWTAADGTVLETPLDDPDNPALVVDHEALGELAYLVDVGFDADGHPVVLYVTSHDHRPGPGGDPRLWRVLHWTGTAWENHEITATGHNYDAGSLYLEDDRWVVFAPTGTERPQEYQTGGEMAIWESLDEGRTWRQRSQVTEDSAANHGYARRALDGRDPFYALWADGDPTEFGPSDLYIGDSAGRHWQLPYTMSGADGPLQRQCTSPDPAATVLVRDVDTGIPNRPAWGGCSVADVIEDDLAWASHGAWMAHVADVTGRLRRDGTITAAERSVLLRVTATRALT